MPKSILAKTDAGETQLTITIPVKTVKDFYDKTLLEITKETTVPGFRKGKAPQKVVEGQIDKVRIYEKVLEQAIPQAYVEAISEHGLKPVISPKIELLKAQEGEDWQFRATTCEKPEVKLGNYKEQVKKALAPTKLWTPDKGKREEKGQEPTQEEKVQKAIQALLESVKVSLPQILVEDEVSHALSSLINQTNSLGMTIDQYLASIGKSGEQLRAEYRQKVEEDLTLQLALDAIAEQEKIQVKDKEIEDFIKVTGDEKVKESLQTPSQRAYLASILKRRKALDFLAKL